MLTELVKTGVEDLYWDLKLNVFQLPHICQIFGKFKGRIFQSSNIIGLVALDLFSKMSPRLYFASQFIKNIGKPF